MIQSTTITRVFYLFFNYFLELDSNIKLLAADISREMKSSNNNYNYSRAGINFNNPNLSKNRGEIITTSNMGKASIKGKMKTSVTNVGKKKKFFKSNSKKKGKNGLVGQAANIKTAIKNNNNLNSGFVNKAGGRSYKTSEKIVMKTNQNNQRKEGIQESISGLIGAKGGYTEIGGYGGGNKVSKTHSEINIGFSKISPNKKNYFSKGDTNITELSKNTRDIASKVKSSFKTEFGSFKTTNNINNNNYNNNEEATFGGQRTQNTKSSNIIFSNKSNNNNNTQFSSKLSSTNYNKSGGGGLSDYITTSTNQFNSNNINLEEMANNFDKKIQGALRMNKGFTRKETDGMSVFEKKFERFESMNDDEFEFRRGGKSGGLMGLNHLFGNNDGEKN